MSWFSGEGLTNQLTSFKDQITTFTKDVLTETTNEIEDPMGELRLAKQRIGELEKLEALQKDEQEKAKQHKNELTERAETAEFQIATLSQEYRKLFQAKDEEVQKLKEENIRLKEQLRLLLLSQEDKSPSVNNSIIMDDLHGDGMDNISDLISSQAEINKLSTQLTKVTAECQYWKELANQEKVTGPDDMESITVQLEDMKRQLAHEQEQHQRELSALQHVHDENMQSLVRRHQAELQQQQPQLPSNNSTDLVDELAAKNEQLETLLNESTQIFEEETQSLKKSLEEKEKSFEEQQVQLKEDSQSLAASLAACQDRVINYQARIEQLQAELTDSQNTVNSLNIKLTQEQQAKEGLCGELDELRRRLAAANDEQVAKVQQEREEMKEELVTLQQKISKQMSTISDLEQAHDRVNQEMEQMTLLLTARETDIVNLQNKKEESFCHIQQQLNKELTEAKLENDRLKEQLKEVTVSVEKVLIDKDTQTVTNGDQTITIEDLQKLEQLQLECAANETDLKSQVSEKEETIKSLTEQVQQLTEALQLTEGTQCHNCSHLKKQVENFQLKFEPLEVRVVTMETENKELTEEVKRLREGQATNLDVVNAEKNRLQSELAKCTKELERLKTHLLQVEQDNSEEIIGFQERENNLKLKVMQAEEQLAISANSKDLMSQENQQKVDQLTEQLYAIAQQRDSISLQLAGSQEENDQLHQQLTNLQMVLEEFQKDQSSKFNSSKQMHEKELILITGERNSLHDELEQTKRRLDHVTSLLKNMESLQLQLQDKEQLIKDLKQQVENFQLHLMNREQKFSLLSEQEENRVDKDLVKNLFLGYLTAASHKKNEVLKLITSILEFSPKELEQITKQGSSGWISNLWKKATPPSSPADQQVSFSKLFIKFLENESNKQNSLATVTAASSYIDPRTDPDKPLLATAAMVSSVPSVSVPHRVPSLPTFVQVTNSNTSQVTNGNTLQVNPSSNQQVVNTHPATSTVTSQNLILSELLTSTDVQ